MRLEGFSPRETELLGIAVAAMETAGYDIALIQLLIRADLPPGYRGMSWENGAVLGVDAFSSQAMLNHVLEEELLHLLQRWRGLMKEFGPGTASVLEVEADAERRFPLPGA